MEIFEQMKESWNGNIWRPFLPRLCSPTAQWTVMVNSLKSASRQWLGHSHPSPFANLDSTGGRLLPAAVRARLAGFTDFFPACAKKKFFSAGVDVRDLVYALATRLSPERNPSETARLVAKILDSEHSWSDEVHWDGDKLWADPRWKMAGQQLELLLEEAKKPDGRLERVRLRDGADELPSGTPARVSGTISQLVADAAKAEWILQPRWIKVLRRKLGATAENDWYAPEGSVRRAQELLRSYVNEIMQELASRPLMTSTDVDVDVDDCILM
jgi:hypothetical protein